MGDRHTGAEKSLFVRQRILNTKGETGRRDGEKRAKSMQRFLMTFVFCVFYVFYVLHKSEQGVDDAQSCMTTITHIKEFG